jgi:hypothetical protein
VVWPVSSSVVHSGQAARASVWVLPCASIRRSRSLRFDAGELAGKWTGDLVVAGLERGEAVADLVQIGEVVGG